MERRALAAQVTRNQLGHASWLDVVEAALVLLHGDDLASGEVLPVCCWAGMSECGLFMSLLVGALLRGSLPARVRLHLDRVPASD